jgi:glycosyltransferase involved in cell wall biosynthesis
MKEQSKPTILHVIQTLGPGGAERLLVTYLSQPLLKDNFNHIVVMTDIKDIHEKSQRTFFVKALESINVEVIGIGCAGPRNLLRSICKLFKIIRNRKISLVHSHLIWSNIAGRIAGRLARVPVISSFHNTDYDPQVVASFTAPKWKQDLIKCLDGWTARNCDFISIAVSEYVGRHIHEHLRIKKDRIAVVYNPVDLSHINPTIGDPRLEKCRYLGIEKDSIIILSVGRVTDQKAFIELVDAFARLVKELPEMQINLVIVGAIVDQIYHSRLIDRIEMLNIKNRVFLTGPQSDIGNWLVAADIFAFPTKFEGLGIALAEAMGVGLPCVATNVGPIPELIENEKTGLLIELNVIDSLVEAIKRLLLDRSYAKALGQSAREFVSNRFSATEKSMQLYQIYKRIIKP